MGERKVQCKYFPPDFDPALLPKRKNFRDEQIKVRIMIPFTVQCGCCGEFIYRGTKFTSRKEDCPVEENYLGLRKFRFYIKCPNCLQEIVFKTDPQNSDYELEKGGTRNYEPWKQNDEIEKMREEEREKEERGDSMKALENRTLESKREMDILDALEEIKELNARKAQFDANSILDERDKQDKSRIAQKLVQEAAEDDAALRKWVCAMEQIVQVEYEGDVPSEYVLASMLPLLCQDGRVLEAVSLLRRSVDSGKETRLRGFHPVLSALGHDGNIDLFVEMWDSMLRPLEESGAGVRPKEQQLLDAVRVTKAAETEERAEALLTHFLHDILRHMYPPVVSVEAAAEMQQLLGDTRSCRVVMPAVATDHDTPAGWCPLTHTQLQVVRLSADERLAMRTALYQLAEEKVTANSARRGSKAGHAKMIAFEQAMRARFASGRPLRFVVDGANVAYCHQNFHGGSFAYSQIDVMLERLIKDYGCSYEEILLLVPEKYLQDVVPNHVRKNRTRWLDVPQRDRERFERWADLGILQAVPRGADDDWWWLLSCVSEYSYEECTPEEAARLDSGPAELDRPIAVTNDNIRDHRLAILQPEAFDRFLKSQMLRFDFPYDESWVVEQKHALELYPPRSFSREMQHCTPGTFHVPVHHRDDAADAAWEAACMLELEQGARSVPHFVPRERPGDDDWLVVCPGGLPGSRS